MTIQTDIEKYEKGNLMQIAMAYIGEEDGFPDDLLDNTDYRDQNSGLPQRLRYIDQVFNVLDLLDKNPSPKAKKYGDKSNWEKEKNDRKKEGLKKIIRATSLAITATYNRAYQEYDRKRGRTINRFEEEYKIYLQYMREFLLYTFSISVYCIHVYTRIYNKKCEIITIV
jgi:hypothetical protein